jgi:hypothetical protein
MTDQPIHLSNNPPLVDVDTLTDRHKEQFALSQAILNAEVNLPTEVKSEADLEALTKHVKDARGSWAKLDAARDTEKRPFMDASNMVQGVFKTRLDKLDATKKVAEARLTAHNRKVEEEERRKAAGAAQREREEAQRRAAAAAALETAGHADVAETVMDGAVEAERTAQRFDALSTGSAADLVRVQTAGGTVSSSSKLKHEVVDQQALRATLGVLADHFALPEIDKAIRAYIAAEKKAGREPKLAGVRFFNDTKAIVR